MAPKIGENNFDLIRLFAAGEVAVLHVSGSLSPTWNSTWLASILECFPGVPIFFFISGFLISRAYEKTGSLSDYARNRSLRIFPALHVCVLVNILMVAATGYFATVDAGFFDVLVLYLAKTTILQFYNPDFMRQFGDGVLNGSLWTICVELQFYFLTPILYRLFIERSAGRGNLPIIVLLILSLICNRILYAAPYEYWQSNWWKVARVSFAPWIYMFLFGVLVQRNFAFFSALLRKHLFVILLVLYTAFALALKGMGYQMDNSFSPVLFFPLMAVVFAGAFSATTLARRLLEGQDISYGVYIYHVPVMNMLLYYGYQGSLKFTLITVVVTIVIAIASWLLIERPCLKRKRRATHPLSQTAS